jgi:hypothetical protein
MRLAADLRSVYRHMSIRTSWAVVFAVLGLTVPAAVVALSARGTMNPLVPKKGLDVRGRLPFRFGRAVRIRPWNARRRVLLVGASPRATRACAGPVGAASRDDLGPMLERWAAECEVHPGVVRVVEGEAGVFRGHEGLREFRWLELREAFADFDFVPSEMRRRGSLSSRSDEAPVGAAAAESNRRAHVLADAAERAGQSIWGRPFASPTQPSPLQHRAKRAATPAPSAHDLSGVRRGPLALRTRSVAFRVHAAGLSLRLAGARVIRAMGETLAPRPKQAPRATEPRRSLVEVAVA